MDINNYSFEFSLLETPKHFAGPHLWLCIITNINEKTKFGVKFHWNQEQPDKNAIFEAFSNRGKFKEQFFIESDMEIIKEESPKTVDIPAEIPHTTNQETVTENNVQNSPDSDFVEVKA